MSQFLRSCILGFAMALTTLGMVSLVAAQTPPKPVSGPPEAPALPADIPGGIVYLEAGNAVYQDFATGQKTNLTAEIPEFQPKGPWTVSEDGRMLCWFRDGKFLVRDLLAKNDLKVDVETSCVGLGNINYLPQAATINNLTISPGGRHVQIAYESVIQGISFLQTKLSRADVLLLDKNSQSLYTSSPTSRWPLYKQVPDTFNGIVRIDIENTLTVCYGNTAGWYPSKSPRLLEFEKNKISAVGAMPAGDPDGVEDGIRGDPGTEVPPQLLVKRNARFPAWQKASSFQNGEGMLALIYKTEEGWGPIEIRRCRASKYGEVAVHPGGFGTGKDGKIYNLPQGKPPFWRLLVSVDNFSGLAWRPDGSLSYLSGVSMFVIDKKQIESGIRRSASIFREFKYPPVINAGGMQFRYPAGTPPVIEAKSLNAAFPVKTTVFARGIKGDRLHWVSDGTFLFRGSDKALYSCTNGTTKKMLESVPAEFFYCSGTQVAGTNATSPLAGVASATPQEDEIRRAVEWATGKYGQAQGKTFGPEWEYYEGCQKFVANAYGKPCPFYSYATAAEGAQRLNAEMNKGKTPPRGSWVFYTCKTDPRGHVALAVGDGFVIHASTNMAKKVATVRMDNYDDVPGADYIGWAWPQRKK